MTQSERAAQAAERLFERYADELYRFARFSLGHAGEAEDVVQEVFARALRSWERFAGRASERTLLFSIARHVIADSVRRLRRESAQTKTRLDTAQTVPAVDDWRLDLEASLRLLPLAQRQIFILRIIEDRSAQETAAMVGRSAVWVRVTLHRALGRLRADLAGADATRHREGGIV